jgi:hypothetical protein
MPETLDGKAVDWSRPPHNDPVAEVVIGPVRYVGRVSGLLDADTEGRPGDLRDYRPVYPARCPIDNKPVRQKGDTYCSRRCRETAKKRRRRGREIQK